MIKPNKPHKLIIVIVLILVGSTILYTQRAVQAARHANRKQSTRISRLTIPQRSERQSKLARRSRGVRLQPYPLRGTHYPYKKKQYGYKKQSPNTQRRHYSRFWYRRPYGYYHHVYPYSYSSYVYDDYNGNPHRYSNTYP